MAQNIIYSPWDSAKDPWLCLMIALLLVGLFWPFSFVSVFLTFLIKLFLWLKFSTDKRQAEDIAGWRVGKVTDTPQFTRSHVARHLGGFQFSTPVKEFLEPRFLEAELLGKRLHI